MLAAAGIWAQDLSLMPWPAQVNMAAGELLVDANFKLGLSGPGASDPRVRNTARRMLYRLFRETGIPISQELSNESTIPTLSIIVERKKSGLQNLGDDESYHLSITQQSARIVATEPLGALRGME